MTLSMRVLVSIATADLARLEAFYTALFKAPPQFWQGDRYCEYHVANLRLGLYSSNNSRFVTVASAMSLCVQVAELEPWLTPDMVVKTASHGREVEVYDPDGNRIVLHEPAPSFWPQLFEGETP